MTPITVMMAMFGIVGLAVAFVRAPTRSTWRDAGEHSQAFWLGWIAGFTGLACVGPAMAGLGWAPAMWFAAWGAVAALQPAMVTDVIEVLRLGSRRAAADRIAAPQAASPAIRWAAPPTPTESFRR